MKYDKRFVFTSCVAALLSSLQAAYDGPNSGLGLGSRPLKAAAEGRRDELRRMMNHIEVIMAAKELRAKRNPHRYISLIRQVDRLQKKFLKLIPIKSPVKRKAKAKAEEATSGEE